MKLLLATFLAMFLFLPGNALPQISCFGYTGGMTSCSGPRSNTLITPLSPTQGIVQGDRDGHSYMEPYTIFPPSSSARDSFSSRRDDSFSSLPIEPLDRLDLLDSDRHSDLLNDPLLPLLLGE